MKDTFTPLCDHDDDHDHDKGLVHDLPRMIGRRGMFSLAAGMALAASGGRAMAASCVALPWETAGPYPADGSNTRSGQMVNALTQSGVLRSDLRGSFAGMTAVADGVALELEISLQDAAGCTPLPGHAIYVWHCDATGRYSLYDVPEANWLRGVAVADAEGRVRFTTIVPGCYDGRWPHIHFEVFQSAEAAMSGEASVLTAQIALPQAECAAVYAANPAYANGTRNLGRISLDRDNVFGNNSAEALAQQTLVMRGDPVAGYRGSVAVPVDFGADRTMDEPPPGGWFGSLFGWGG